MKGRISPELQALIDAKERTVMVTETELAELRAALAGMKDAFLGAAAERDALRAEVERLKTENEARAKRHDPPDPLWEKRYLGASLEIERLKAELHAKEVERAGYESMGQTTRATLAEREAEIERARNAVEPFRDESGTWVDWVEYLAACVKDCRCAEYARQRDEARAALEECAGHPKCRATLAEREAEIAKLQAENWRVLNEAELEFVRRAATARAEALEEAAERLKDWDRNGAAAGAIRALASDTKGET